VAGEDPVSSVVQAVTGVAKASWHLEGRVHGVPAVLTALLWRSGAAPASLRSVATECAANSGCSPPLALLLLPAGGGAWRGVAGGQGLPGWVGGLRDREGAGRRAGIWGAAGSCA
jgi:hypothetical protein